jgi:uncharacterized protein DUF1573
MRHRRAIPVFLGSIAFVLLVAFGAARAWYSNRPAYPVLNARAYEFDFGRLKPLQEAEARITIENRGGQVLKMEVPTATCGCQTPSLAKRVLAPGEQTKLTLRQRVGAQSGPFLHMVFLRSNDPNFPEQRITFVGTVSKGVIVRPEPLVFDALSPGEAKTRHLELVSDNDKPFRITFLDTSGPLRAKGTLDVPSRLHRVEVTLLAGETIGPVEGHVTLKLDLPGDPPLFVPVKGTVRGTVRLAPSVLDLGNVGGYSEATGEVLLSSNGKSFQLLDVKLGDSGWDLRRRELPRANEKSPLRVQLTIRVPNTPGIVKTHVEVEIVSDGGKRETTTLLVVGAVNTLSTQVPRSLGGSNR